MFLVCPASLFAQSSPPRLINLQAVLVDEGGNVLYNQQEADIIFSIVDGAGETFYEEEQHVVLVNGAISVLVGQGIDMSTGGATGGIPLEALEPEGTKLLRVKLKDQSIPQEDLELATVPYAMYADKAYSLVEPLDSEGILDGTIIQADLSSELIAYIDDRAGSASEDQVTQHRQEDGAHPAASISVVNTFINASGNNVQQILIGLDRAIGTRRNQEGVLGEEIDEETADRTAADTAETAAREAAVSAEAASRAAAVATEAASRAAADASESATREAADTAEATTRASEDTRVLESEISRAGDSIYGDITFYTDETLSTQTMSIAPMTGNISSTGELSLLDGLVSINRDASTSDPVLSIDDTDGVERLRLDGDTGLMTIDGNVTITGTVDGVDVSTEQATRMATDDELRGDIAAHTGAVSGIHGVSGNVVGTSDAQTLTNKTLGSTTMAGTLLMEGNAIVDASTVTAGSLAGEGLSITNIAGGNIQAGTVSGAQITDGTVTTTDMSTTDVSQWSNDAGYISDGNSGWDNTYGFITDGNSGWDNSYGLITDGNEGWNNEYGFVTGSHTHDYAASSHTHDYAPSGHTHDYAASAHSHGGLIVNYQIVSRSCVSGAVRPQGSCFIACPGGTSVTGGGCSNVDGIETTYPASDGSGWTCAVVPNRTYTGWAVCLGWQ